MLFWLCGTVLSVGSAFGGGTHAGYLGDFAAQLLSIPAARHGALARS